MSNILDKRLHIRPALSFTPRPAAHARPALQAPRALFAPAPCKSPRAPRALQVYATKSRFVS